MQQCPWHGLEPATVKFCEEHLCSWVTQPSNTWSNIAFIIVGVLIFKLSRRSSRASLQLIGISAIVTGLGSGMFHASSTFFFEVFDLMGMFMISGILLTLNMQRLFAISNVMVSVIYVILTAASVGLMFAWRPSGIATFALQLTCALTLELLLHLRRDRISYKPFVHMVLTFSFAFVFWALDISGILCKPDNHILTGHAVWHVLNAVAIFFIYRFYDQFTGEEKGRFSLEPAP